MAAHASSTFLLRYDFRFGGPNRLRRSLDNGVSLLSGKEAAFTQKQAGAFGVDHREKMEVLAGDQLLLQANRKTESLSVRNGDVAVVRFELAREAQGLERKRERHSFFGRARVWAKRATKAWQQQLCNCSGP